MDWRHHLRNETGVPARVAAKNRYPAFHSGRAIWTSVGIVGGDPWRDVGQFGDGLFIGGSAHHQLVAAGDGEDGISLQRERTGPFGADQDQAGVKKAVERDPIPSVAPDHFYRRHAPHEIVHRLRDQLCLVAHPIQILTLHIDDSVRQILGEDEDQIGHERPDHQMCALACLGDRRGEPGC